MRGVRVTYSLVKGGEDLNPEIIFNGSRKQCLLVMQAEINRKHYKTLKLERKRNLFIHRITTKEFRYAILNLKKA